MVGSTRDDGTGATGQYAFGFDDDVAVLRTWIMVVESAHREARDHARRCSRGRM